MNVDSYSAKQIDLTSGMERSTQSLLTGGAWFFKQIAEYTSSSPFTLAVDEKKKFTFQPDDAGFTQGKYFDLLYDFTAQKFTPVTADNVYLANIRFKATSDLRNSQLDILLESPTVLYNPINADSVSFNRTPSTEHFKSSNLLVFIGEDIVTNGVEVYFESHEANMEIYDISFMIVQLYNDAGNRGQG